MPALRYIEFGYTRDVHQGGSNASLSPLWGDGFNSFHAKLNVIPEDHGGMRWVPAVAAGFVVRTQVRNVGGQLAGKDSNNGDYYLVATKTVHLNPV